MQPPCTDSASLELVKPLTGQTTNRHGILELVPCHQSNSIMTDTTQSKRLENAVAPSGGQNGSVAEELSNLRTRCPLPVLMSRMGYAKFATRLCRSPFRPDKNASWGIVRLNGRWIWKDFATGEHGVFSRPGLSFDLPNTSASTWGGGCPDVGADDSRTRRARSHREDGQTMHEPVTLTSPADDHMCSGYSPQRRATARLTGRD